MDGGVKQLFEGDVRMALGGNITAGWKAGIILTVALASAVVLNGCEKKQPPPAARPPAAVTAVDVVVRSVPYYLDEIGRCSSRESVTLRAQVAGRVIDAHFVEGAD